VLWSNGATTPSITGLVAGDYIVSVTDARSCITRDTFTVTQPAPLTISNVVPINLLCRDIPNGQLALTVVGGTPPYVTNGVLGTTLTGLTFGTVPLTVVDANGCTVTSTSTITAPPLLTLALTTIPENCTEQNGSVTSAVTGGVLPYSYTWSNSRTSPSIGRVSSGSYQLTVVDANACSRVASANVARLDPPSAVIVTNPVPPIILVLPETRVQFVGQTDRGAVFLWEFGDGQTSTAPNPTYTYTDDGEFTVNYTSTDTAGCSNTESFGPIVITKQPTLDVPNVFTPNGDGVNDVYAINLISSFTSDLQAAFVKQFSMRIFDRWGRPVFATSSITSGWAGDVNGTAAPAGVYFFEITVTFVNDLSLSRRGSLTLLR
jgi:gliding motility-associated-like protein